MNLQTKLKYMEKSSLCTMCKINQIKQATVSFISISSDGLFFLLYLESGFLSVPYGSYFSPTWNLGSLLGLSYVPVFSQAPLS